MKSLKYIIGSLVMVLSVQFLNAQDCSTYFPTKKGASLETQSFDKKGKLSGISRFKVLETKNTPDGLRIKANSEIYVPDENNEVSESDTALFNSDLVFYCKNGEFYIDMKEFLNSLHLDQYKSMDMEMTSKDMALPANPKPGDVLGDGSLIVVIRNNGIKLVTITLDITNRKVDALEKMTVPAGTFDCVKISYDIHSKIGFIKSTGKTTIWYAKGIGAVKTENYNKKGKLTDYSELTKINL